MAQESSSFIQQVCIQYLPCTRLPGEVVVDERDIVYAAWDLMVKKL